MPNLYCECACIINSILFYLLSQVVAPKPLDLSRPPEMVNLTPGHFQYFQCPCGYTHLEMNVSPSIVELIPRGHR